MPLRVNRGAPSAGTLKGMQSMQGGILPDREIAALFETGAIAAPVERDGDQIQPASLDLRLGTVAHRIRASFLPGPDGPVADKLAEVTLHTIDLTQGAVLETGCVYVVPLQERLALPADGQFNVTTRVPLGPVGVITPWNTPFMLSTWKIAPALAAGCTVVHKPAELSPLTARLLVEIAEEAGLPKGVWNTVNGFGEDAGRALTEHPAIRAIAFVGESATGSAIMAQAAPTLKRVHFELGGKNPVIVFRDADLDRAAEAAVFMIYSLNGERCTSSSRLLVDAEIYDAFTAKVAEKAKAPWAWLRFLAC